MNQRLTINGDEADLGGQVLAYTKQQYSFSDWQKRRIDRTNEVQLPKSQVNRRIFSSPDRVNSTNTSFESYYNAKLFIDEVPVITGVAILTETNDAFSLRLIDASKQFFDSLSEKLRFIDFEDDDFIFTLANYNILKVPTSSVWIWPVVNNHEERNTSNTALISSPAASKTKFSRPALRCDKIVQEIVARHGWQIDITDDYDELSKGFLTTNHEHFYVTSYQKTLTGNLSVSSKTAVTGLTTNDFEHGLTVGASILNIGDTKTKFRLRGSITLTQPMYFTIEGTSSPSGDDTLTSKFYLQAGTYDVDLTTADYSTSEATNNIAFYFTPVSASGQVTFNNTLLYTLIEEMDLGAPSTNALVDYYVKVHDNMPDLSQMEFLRQEWTINGAFFETNSFTKTFTTYSFERLSKLNSVDWSNEFIDMSEKITAIAGDYGQKTYARYTGDDIAGENIGEGSFPIGNATLPDEAEIVKLKYSPSSDIVLGTYDMIDMPIYSDSERVNEAGVRRGVWYYDTTGSTFTIGKFNGLDWTILLNTYYAEVIASLNRSRVIEAEFALSRLQVNSFNFRQLVYVEYFSSYFIVLEIQDFIAGKPTKVKMLRYI